MPENSTISGFQPNGFDFNSLVNSVGNNVQTWALQALNRQSNIDTAERPPVPVASVLGEETFFTKAMKNTWLIVGVVAVVGFVIWKKFIK